MTHTVYLATMDLAYRFNPAFNHGEVQITEDYRVLHGDGEWTPLEDYGAFLISPDPITLTQRELNDFFINLLPDE